MSYRLILGDCREVMAGMDEGSVDAIVTDPPYGLEFMGVAWDTMRDDGKPIARNEWGDFGSREHPREAAEVARVQRKKSLGLQQFSEAWAREALRIAKPGAHLVAFGGTRMFHRLACALEDVGWQLRDTLCWLYGQGFPKGKAQLKPAWEPITLARKPGPLRLNVEACRLAARGEAQVNGAASTGAVYGQIARAAGKLYGADLGRWPTNVVLDKEAAAMLDAQAETHAAGHARPEPGGGSYDGTTGIGMTIGIGHKGFRFGDSGGASRFFYMAKASSGERHYAGKNHHPTVKPVDLMRWLCRLVTPPGGLIVDPFMGSGSTGIAALAEGFCFTGIEKEQAYLEIARKRIAGPLFAQND